MLAVLDPRLRTMGYGARFLASLPPAPVTHDIGRDRYVLRCLTCYHRYPHRHASLDRPARTLQSATASTAAEMGGGQAPAASAAAAASIRADFNALFRAVPRQRRRLPRSAQQRAARGRAVRLSDINADLIGCYRDGPRSHGRGDCGAARAERRYRAGGAAHFYGFATSVQPARRRPAGDPAVGYTPALAAMLIFLNRTGFNGLFRSTRRASSTCPPAATPTRRSATRTTCGAVEPAALDRSSVRLLDVPRSTRPWATRGAGRLHLPRPAVCAAERHVAVHLLHRRRLRRRPAGALQRTVMQLASQGRVGPAQQFRGAADPALYAGRGAARSCRAAGPRPSRPAGRSTPGPPAAVRSASTSSPTSRRCKLPPACKSL